MQVLITGHSRGLGAALAAAHLARGDTVYGLSRGALPAQAGLHQQACDLADGGALEQALASLLGEERHPDLVYLNAGKLGRIAALIETGVDELAQVLNINTWANKRLIDVLVQRRRLPAQLIAMSSGAAVVGHHGWAAYCLSKAALNMLMQLYAHELRHCHLLALAPGLVDSDMQAELRTVDAARFPSVARLQQAHGTPDMPSPAEVAARIIGCLPRLRELPSGSFADLRKLPD